MPSSLSLLVQLLTWSATEQRHRRSSEQRRRLMDVVALIADTEGGAAGNVGSPRSSKGTGGGVKLSGEMRLDELLELAQVSLAAHVAVLHTLDKGMLQMSRIKFRQESNLKVGLGQQEGASSKADSDVTLTPEFTTDAGADVPESPLPAQAPPITQPKGQVQQLCSVGQGIIGFCALTLQTINSELTWLKRAEVLTTTAISSPQGITTTTAPPLKERLVDPDDRLDMGVDIPSGLQPQPMAIACIPIADQAGVCVGVLEVLDKESPYKGSVARFTDSDIIIMRILSTAFAAAMQK